MHSFIDSLIDSIIDSSIDPFIRSLIHSLVHLGARFPNQGHALADVGLGVGAGFGFGAVFGSQAANGQGGQPTSGFVRLAVNLDGRVGRREGGRVRMDR